MELNSQFIAQFPDVEAILEANQHCYTVGLFDGSKLLARTTIKSIGPLSALCEALGTKRLPSLAHVRITGGRMSCQIVGSGKTVIVEGL